MLGPTTHLWLVPLFNSLIQLDQPEECTWAESLDLHTCCNAAWTEATEKFASIVEEKPFALHNTVLKVAWPRSRLESGVIQVKFMPVETLLKMPTGPSMHATVQEGWVFVWGERSSTRKFWHFQETTQDVYCVWNKCQAWKNSIPPIEPN